MLLGPKSRNNKGKRNTTWKGWLQNFVVFSLAPECATHKIQQVHVSAIYAQHSTCPSDAIAQGSVRLGTASLTCFKFWRLTFSQLELQVSNTLVPITSCWRSHLETQVLFTWPVGPFRAHGSTALCLVGVVTPGSLRPTSSCHARLHSLPACFMPCPNPAFLVDNEHFVLHPCPHQQCTRRCTLASWKPARST